jgi:uncharacterized membrane protein YebE (DUF533 family)
MSLKRMMTRMAIAFIAAKGVQTFRRAGGFQGIRDKLAQSRQNDVGGMQGRIGGTKASSAGGLGNLLGSLGIGGATGATEDGARGQISENAGVGEIIGDLAGVSGDREKTTGLLARTRADDRLDDEREAGLVIRAMIQAARADGGIDPDERSALMEILADADPSDQRFIDQAMEEDVDATALAQDVPEGAELEVYSAALMAIEPDNRAEAEYLHALASGLGLSEARVNEIHDAMGMDRLY